MYILDLLQMTLLVQRPLSFLEFDFKSTYIPGFDPSDKFLYQITVPLSTEPELR